MTSGSIICKMRPKGNYEFMYRIKSFSISIKYLFAFVCGNENDIIFITDQDEVYGLGCNKTGRLGLGHINPVSEPAKIVELCGIEIMKLNAGNSFMVALTANKHIYAWGYSYRGQMGNGKDESVYSKPFKVNITEDIKVVDIKCTGGATNLLTQSGHLYWFGYYTDLLYGLKLTNLIPAKFIGGDDIEFISIACGYKHTLALTITGQLYAFGSNSFGQLDIACVKYVHSLTLCKSIEDKLIKKVSCGAFHNIVLTSDESIYSCGCNSCGQLGIGSAMSQTEYTLIGFMKGFIDIFAFGNTSMALCANKFIYIWGLVNGQNILRPKRTDFKSFQSAIDYYSKPIFTYSPLTNEELFEPMNPIIKSMSKAFNSEKYSDLRFKIGDKVIYVCKWFLALNCRHFETMFSNNWSETQLQEENITEKSGNESVVESMEMIETGKHSDKKSYEIQINHHTYPGYLAFLRCIYTDIIDTDNIEILVDFLDITNEYLEEGLKLKCANHLKRLINLDNACALYSAALKFNSIELQVYCFEYMCENMDKIIDTEDYRVMDGIYAKIFLSEYFREKREFK